MIFDTIRQYVVNYKRLAAALKTGLVFALLFALRAPLISEG
jgi:hypothetical protein